MNGKISQKKNLSEAKSETKISSEYLRNIGKFTKYIIKMTNMANLSNV